MQLRSKQIVYLAALVSAAAVFACGAATGETGKEAKGKKATGAADSTAAAVIGDKTITLAELDAKAAGPLVKVRQDEYEARRQVLESLINDEVMAKEQAFRRAGGRWLLYVPRVHVS